jgi:hypothetical protein
MTLHKKQQHQKRQTVEQSIEQISTNLLLPCVLLAEGADVGKKHAVELTGSDLRDVEVRNEDILR